MELYSIGQLARQSGVSRKRAVNAEIERLERLKKVIAQAREDLERREDPWRYLQNLQKVTCMTNEERARWWAERWRQILSRYPVEEEIEPDSCHLC